MRLLIYGSRDFAATVVELVRHSGHEVAGMVDDYSNGPGILGDLNTVIRSHPASEYGVALAIGYSNIEARWGAWEKIHAAGYHAPALIHPRAYVADTAQVGEGAMIMAGAIVDVRAEIGELSVLWPGACINHDTKIGLNTFVSPGANICGFVNIGPHSFIGAGATIADHCQVPERSFIKMHSSYSRKDP